MESPFHPCQYPTLDCHCPDCNWHVANDPDSHRKLSAMLYNMATYEGLTLQADLLRWYGDPHEFSLNLTTCGWWGYGSDDPEDIIPARQPGAEYPSVGVRYS